MMEDTPILLPKTAGIFELMEAHRQLISYSNQFAHENDTYSLAQPSPFRFVPTIASNQTAPLPVGE